MLRDLQEAVYGVTYAAPHSPADEWRRLLAEVGRLKARASQAPLRSNPLTFCSLSTAQQSDSE